MFLETNTRCFFQQEINYSMLNIPPIHNVNYIFSDSRLLFRLQSRKLRREED